jgi:hypothetical protein
MAKKKKDLTEVYVEIVTLFGTAHMRAPAFLADQMAEDFVEPRVFALRCSFESGDTCTFAAGKIVSIGKMLALAPGENVPKAVLVEYGCIKHYKSDEP